MKAPKIKDVATYLELLAPRSYQEAYDNAGLLTGNPETEIAGVLVTLDCTEDVIAEAIRLKCNLIVAHHPIIFKGLKKLVGQTYVERTIIAAIKHDIAIYAAHTNLDNVHNGVNKKIAEKLDLTKTRILAPRKDTLSKLVTFAPSTHAEQITLALHAAGAGHIGNYSHCSFQSKGTGSFQPDADATPFVGQAGQTERVDETRIELLFPSHIEASVVRVLKSAHPYEEVAYYITKLENENQEVGAGLIGELTSAEEQIHFLQRLKRQMGITYLRHTHPLKHPLKIIALCGGAGSFLLPEAIRQGADIFISADFKYHEFFDAEGKIMIADIGHYESEQFTKELFVEVLSKKFPTFAINFSNTVTNPISYL
jgi:dinuclear metal center YbgI/SA1388 family protein